MPEAAVKVVDPPVKVTLEPCVMIAVGRGLTVTFKYCGGCCNSWKAAINDHPFTGAVACVISVPPFKYPVPVEDGELFVTNGIEILLFKGCTIVGNALFGTKTDGDFTIKYKLAFASVVELIVDLLDNAIPAELKVLP